LLVKAILKNILVSNFPHYWQKSGPINVGCPTFGKIKNCLLTERPPFKTLFFLLPGPVVVEMRGEIVEMQHRKALEP